MYFILFKEEGGGVEIIFFEMIENFIGSNTNHNIEQFKKSF